MLYRFTFKVIDHSSDLASSTERTFIEAPDFAAAAGEFVASMFGVCYDIVSIEPL